MESNICISSPAQDGPDWFTQQAGRLVHLVTDDSVHWLRSAASDKSCKFEAVCNFHNEKSLKGFGHFPIFGLPKVLLDRAAAEKDFRDDKPGVENIYLNQRKPDIKKHFFFPKRNIITPSLYLFILLLGSN